MNLKIKEQIRDLLRGKTETEKLIYIESEYFVLRAGELIKLSDNEVLRLLPDSEVMAFFVNKKVWNKSGSFEGAEVDPLPEILKDKKVMSFEVDSPETCDTLINLRSGNY